jgi:uncharacterized membrane protein
MTTHQRTFGGDFKRFFGRGMAILLPSMLTLWILWQAFAFVSHNVGEPINKGIRLLVIETTPLFVRNPAQRPAWYQVTDADIREFHPGKDLSGLPAGGGPAVSEKEIAEIQHEIRHAKFRKFWDSHWYLSGTGLVVAIILIYLAGLLLGGLIGRRVYARLEALISRVPGFKQIYPHVKQLVELVIGDKPMAFSRVVLVQFPRPGAWMLAFVTGESLRRVTEHTGQRCVTVFVPHTPTPFTGFTLSVPETDVIDVPVTMDEALRYVITGGVLVPAGQAAATLGSPGQEAAKRILASGAGRVS